MTFNHSFHLLVAASLWGACSAADGQVPQDAIRTTVCELSNAPVTFVGATVAIRGWIGRGRNLTLLDAKPSKGCRNVILPIVLPTTVRPAPDFKLQVDEPYRQFQKALSERTHIEGTFLGRFDYLKHGKTRIRLVLRQVEDLDVTPTAHPIDR